MKSIPYDVMNWHRNSFVLLLFYFNNELIMKLERTHLVYQGSDVFCFILWFCPAKTGHTAERRPAADPNTLTMKLLLALMLAPMLAPVLAQLLALQHIGAYRSENIVWVHWTSITTETAQKVLTDPLDHQLISWEHVWSMFVGEVLESCDPCLVM